MKNGLKCYMCALQTLANLIFSQMHCNKMHCDALLQTKRILTLSSRMQDTLFKMNMLVFVLYSLPHGYIIFELSIDQISGRILKAQNNKMLNANLCVHSVTAICMWELKWTSASGKQNEKNNKRNSGNPHTFSKQFHLYTDCSRWLGVVLC